MVRIYSPRRQVHDAEAGKPRLRFGCVTPLIDARLWLSEAQRVNHSLPTLDAARALKMEDRVGSLVEVRSTLEIREGGVPRADVVQAAVEFSPKVVPLGATLYFTATVENFGKVPIRTTGPRPGTGYTTEQIIRHLRSHGVIGET